MDALKFIREFERMCDCYSGRCCTGCPRKEELICDESMMDDDEFKKLISDVEKWSKEHPRKTRLQDFWEKYPNAQLRDDGLPYSCCEALGYGECCKQTSDPCFDCWNVPVEEDE